MEKIEEIRRDGKTIFFVSHELDKIQAVCKTCMLLKKGKIITVGPTNDVINQYHQMVEEIKGIGIP